jgi:hypothetical protein
MARSYTTPDGFTLRIFSSMYLDWGLEISGPDGENLYYNPHCIASDCVGFYFEDEDGEPLEEGIDWSDEDWQEYLECEADTLIECFVSDDQFGESLNE